MPRRGARVRRPDPARESAPRQTVQSRVDSLDLEGRGVARHDGKVVFIEGALPGEVVRWERLRGKARFDVGRVVEVVRASPFRVAPGCPNFGIGPGYCGGCSMQHLDARTQVAIKQRVLEETLWHIGKVRPGRILRPVAGQAWNYRHRARLAARFVAAKGGVLVGFHERGSSFVADMHGCPVLARPVDGMLDALRALVGTLSIRERLPQIEVAIGADSTVLVLRVLEPPAPDDLARLRAFAAEHAVTFWLQPAGPASAAPMDPAGGSDGPAIGPGDELHLGLPEFGVSLPFQPTDFTQVNHRANEVLVRRALALLDPQLGERIADFFCGLGNFTLPIARSAALVFGIEGSESLLARARAAADRHGLAERTRFSCANLFTWTAQDWNTLLGQAGGRIERVLIDPPREGALALVQAIASHAPPRRIVYVSCAPATLARDLAWLVHEAGWRVPMAGVVNMFAHTSHVESVAVLEPPA
jgi:23S rRNA (uracil1939-C5)-methyltransferase